MKKEKHNNYVETKVTCACGNTFTVYSNKPDFNVDEVKKIVNEIEPDVCVILDMEDDKKNKELYQLIR